MSKKKKKLIEETEDILNKAKKIVSLEESIKEPSDKSYIQCIKFIFTKEFTLASLSLPIPKKEKESFQYLKTFVNVFDILFNKNENERYKLYQSEISSKALGIDLFNSMQNLRTFAERKNVGYFKSNEFENLNDRVNFIFCNYLKGMANTLLGTLNLYFYYLGFFIKSIKPLNFLLYYFLQVDEIFKQFEYSEFCPDLNSNNCLNLIILFFESIVKEPIEILSIYALLIFKYQYIFRSIDDCIGISVLEKSVKETVYIVKEKTLKNRIILEYIFYEFIRNLKDNINSIAPQKKLNEIIINEEKNKEIKAKENLKSINPIKKNELNNKNEEIEVKDYKEESANNNKGKKFIDEGEMKKDNIILKPILDKNIINKKEINVNFQSDISGKPNNGEDNSQEKNTINDGINNREKHKIEENRNKIKEKENDSSTSAEYNYSVNVSKDFKNSSQIINEQNSNTCSEKGSEINKSDKDGNIKEHKEKANLSALENISDKSPEFQLLFKEINELKRKSDERYEKLKKKSDERYEKLKKKSDENYKELLNNMIEMKSQLENVQIENRKIKNTLGKIQIRDSAKNILRPYEIYLDFKDKEIIEKDKKKKWEIIASKIKGHYNEYENSDNYKAFAEIVDKSVDAIAKGNDDAHSINIEYYEKDIEKIIKEKKIKFINPIKICFLLQINVSDNLLLKGYSILDKFYENNMIRAFTKGISLEDYFK